MRTSKTTLVLATLCVVGGGALIARFLGGPANPSAKPTTPTATATSTAGAGDGRTVAVRTTRSLKLDKSTNVIPDLDKEALTRELSPKEALESKFRNFRDEGRQQFEAIFQGDQERTRAAMRTLFQNEEFRNLFQQTRALGEKWGQASDQEKVAIMAQMQTLRDKGMGMARAEAARQANGGAVETPPNGNFQGTINITGGAVVAPQGGQPAPAPATPTAPPPAPVIIM